VLLRDYVWLPTQLLIVRMIFWPRGWDFVLPERGLHEEPFLPPPVVKSMIHSAKQNARAILIVEDDPMTRMTATDAFQDAGFAVFEAANVSEALSILAVSSADALFTDIEMPGGINGASLARQTRERWPWIKVAVTSGEATPPAGAMPHDARFFPKPYNIRRVVDHIQRITLAA
jgi:CheY-like chemotaxis protein